MTWPIGRVYNTAAAIPSVVPDRTLGTAARGEELGPVAPHMENIINKDQYIQSQRANVVRSCLHRGIVWCVNLASIEVAGD